mmetsp:Transcript_15810/g.43222  ORF Transcript_15810/g.43222 Transcript_15810/m.43222 type:complete len:254 (-) Transcript_15810:367-1128(-)
MRLSLASARRGRRHDGVDGPVVLLFRHPAARRAKRSARASADSSAEWPRDASAQCSTDRGAAKGGLQNPSLRLQLRGGTDLLDNLARTVRGLGDMTLHSVQPDASFRRASQHFALHVSERRHLGDELPQALGFGGGEALVRIVVAHPLLQLRTNQTLYTKLRRTARVRTRLVGVGTVEDIADVQANCARLGRPFVPNWRTWPGAAEWRAYARSFLLGRGDARGRHWGAGSLRHRAPYRREKLRGRLDVRQRFQ